MELVRKADTANFIACHVNTFEYLGGIPRPCRPPCATRHCYNEGGNFRTTPARAVDATPCPNRHQTPSFSPSPV